MNSKLCHISIDDFVGALQDLSNINYSSLWQQPQFKYFYCLHKIFGAKFTLNIFEKTQKWDISDVTDRFKQELTDASSWLKFAYHGEDETNPKEKEINVDRFQQSYYKVNSNIIRIASKASISKIYRLHYWYYPIEYVDVIANAARGG